MSVNRFLSFNEEGGDGDTTVIQRSEPVNLTPYLLKTELNPYGDTLEVGDLKITNYLDSMKTTLNHIDGRISTNETTIGTLSGNLQHTGTLLQSEQAISLITLMAF